MDSASHLVAGGCIFDHGHEHGHQHGHDHDGQRCDSDHSDDDCDGCSNEHQHGHGHEHQYDKDHPPSDDECSCCSHDHENTDHLHQHGHEHGHEHDHHLHRSREPSEDDCSCCSHDHDHVHVGSFSHDHGHGHQHPEAKSREGSFCSKEYVCVSDTSIPAGHHPIIVERVRIHSVEGTVSRDQETITVTVGSVPMTATLNPLYDIESQREITAEKLTITCCSSCDPNSPIMHAVQVTRFRVANMCCAGEERLIRSTLESVTGVEHIAVNLVGRYVLIKHCPVECCAPAQRIMDMLNALHLGVTIQDISDMRPAEEQGIDVKHTVHIALLCVLFTVGLIFYLSDVDILYETSSLVFIATIAVGILPIAQAACISLFIRGFLDIHLLMVVAIIGAVASREFFDGALVVTLFLLAEYIEDVVVKKVQKAVSMSAGGVLPKEGFLANGKTIAIKDLAIGDILAVRAGEMIVCDGMVTKGEGVVDESALTGECAPVAKKTGSTAYGGTVVENGYLEIQINKNPQESTLARLSQAVAEVQADRGEFAKLIDSFAQYWTPFVLIATIMLIVIGGGVTGDWPSYFQRGLVLLVLACPCAIVISAPIPAICAIASAAHSGVLIRGSTIIERMSTVDTIAVDKTGTMTKAHFQVCDKAFFSEQQPAEYDVMMVAAAVEQKSTHPLAHAIVSDYCGCIAELSDDQSHFPNVRKVRVMDGIGLEAWVEINKEWKHVCIGNERLLAAHGGKVMLTAVELESLNTFKRVNLHKVVLLMSVDDVLMLVLSLADELRPEAMRFVSSVKEMGMVVTMLTGDHAEVAEDTCQCLGIPLDECHSRLLPEQKLLWIKKQQVEQGRHVLMIGDGINDSIALAASTVGVAMGAEGTAMAVAAADVVLMNDNLMLLPPALQLCQWAKRTILQNFAFAVAVKIAAIVLAIMGKLDFWEAVLVDIGSLLVVVANGTKVLRRSGQSALSEVQESRSAKQLTKNPLLG